MSAFWPVLKSTVSEFIEDKVLRLSAALAYYSIFSIAPLLIIAIAIAGAIFGDDAVRGEVADQLQSVIGLQSAETVESMVKSANKPGDGAIMTTIGLITLFFGATGVFGQLKDALNTIWDLTLRPGRGIKGFLIDRCLSFSMVLGTGFLLLTSLVISTVMQAMSGYLGSILPIHPAIWQAISFVSSFVLVTVLFAMIFKILPDGNVRWKDVWVGALFTSGLFGIGRFALGLYLGREETASTYGIAGAFVIVLLWVYYSSVILLFGAEFTQVWTKHHGHRVVPQPHAMRLPELERANQGMPKDQTVDSAS